MGNYEVSAEVLYRQEDRRDRADQRGHAFPTFCPLSIMRPYRTDSLLIVQPMSGFLTKAWCAKYSNYSNLRKFGTQILVNFF